VARVLIARPDTGAMSLVTGVGLVSRS